MARIGIYSGTFNPIHVGHIRAAQYACDALELDRLLLIPDRIAPHKQLPAGSPDPGQRLEMVRLAVQDIPKLEGSGITLELEGPSYSYATVEAVRVRYPKDTLVFLMGTDMFLTFAGWRQPERICAQAELAVLCRGKTDEQALQEQKQLLQSRGAVVHLLSNPPTVISSTMIRRMIPLRCTGEYLPERVKAFVYKNGLYGADKPLKNLSLEELEKAVVALLKPNRVAHVLGCAETARKMAVHWGADETDAHRAGLLHDVTKAMDGPLQLTLCREYGIVLDKFSQDNPKTLHALTGSYAARQIFGENDAVVSAIRSHTTGKPAMNLLEKIIYVADYMEPNRDFPGVEELRYWAYTDIDKALKLGLTMTLDMLKSQKRQISPASESALQYLLDRGV